MEHKEIGELQNELNKEIGSGKTKGFHYTNKANIDDIGDTLEGKIGENLKGSFGKEVNPKLFYAYGVSGAIQILNRNLNLSAAATISFLNDGVHNKAFPNTVKADIENGKKDRVLTPLEAFEFSRKYLEEMALYTFDVKPTEYEHTPTPEQIEEVNDFVDSFEAVPVVSKDYVISVSEEDGKRNVSIDKQNIENSKPVKIKKLIGSLDEAIEALQNEPDSSRNPELGFLILKRDELSMMVRDATMGKLEQFQGKEVQEGNVDRFIFDEDKNRMVDIEANPHNAYTKVTKGEDGFYKSRNIGPEDGAALTTNGGKVAKYTDVMAAVYENKGMDLNPTIRGDVDLAGLFFKYCKLVEMAKRKHLIKDLEGGPDLDHLEFYGDELAALAKEINEACRGITRMDPKEEGNKNAALPTIEIDDELKGVYQKSSQEFVADMGKPEGFLGKMADVGSKFENDLKESRVVGNADKFKLAENDERN